MDEPEDLAVVMHQAVWSYQWLMDQTAEVVVYYTVEGKVLVAAGSFPAAPLESLQRHFIDKYTSLVDRLVWRGWHEARRGM